MDATAKPDLHLVYTSDANYLFLTAVSACSAFAQASDPTRLAIHVLDCGISDDAWEAWRADMVRRTGSERFHRHAVDVARFEGLPPWKGSIATYARLCPPELLPDLDWCVYADGDTLFVDDPLGLIDFFDPSVGLWGWDSDEPSPVRKVIFDWFEANGLEADRQNHICSGFMCLNLKWMRENDVTQRCFDFLRAYKDPAYIDETALNVVCAGHIRLFPKRWGVYALQACTVDRPALIHYISEPLRRLRFNPKIGYRDTSRLWYGFVRHEFGLTIRQACGISPLNWWLGRAYNRAITFAAAVCAKLPLLGRLGAVRTIRSHVLRPQNRYLLSPRLWTERWHGEP